MRSRVEISSALETAPEPSARAPLVFLSAGEASGEHYGALLMEALRRLAPEATFFGLGGPRMAEHGLRRIVRAEDVAHMGITEILRHAPYIYRQYRRLKRSLGETRPDLAILIDFPDVNLRLAHELHRLGVPVVYFVSPQLWAWKKRRIRRVQKYVTRMLVIFPFEEPFYRGHGVPVDFVGHPLADLPLPAISREHFAREYDLDSAKDWVGLLPGSRMREVELNLPEMLRAAAALGPAYEYLLPVAPTLDRARIAALLATSGAQPRVHLTTDARATLHHARASIVASGTATVEAALIGNPFVVVYRLSPLSHAIARRLVTVPHIAMANLIAGRRLVPELIQGDFTASRIVQELVPLLNDTPQRAAMLGGLAEVRSLLRPAHTAAAERTAMDRVARISLTLISPDCGVAAAEHTTH